MNVRYKIFSILFFLSIYGYSQWVCRSKLSSHTKPIVKNFPLMWGIEGTIGEGWMNDREITNAMFFTAFELNFGKHQIYSEGGIKAWRNTADLNPDSSFFNSYKFGMRENFYRFSSKRTRIKAGFQSMLFGDFFLVNERALGLTANQNFGRLDVQLTGGTVLKDFSRFGTFCSVHYLYDILEHRPHPKLGNNPGETNFSGFVISWTPSKQKLQKQESEEEFEEFAASDSGDEFEEFGSETGEDEFESFEDDDKESGTNKVFQYLKNDLLSKTGVLLYSEYGEFIDNQPVLFGGFAEFSLPADFKLKSEIVFQNSKHNNAIIFYNQLSRNQNWKNKQQTFFAFTTIIKNDIDKNSDYQASFSNMFIGEVVRMDAYDMPLYQIALRHRFTKIRLHIKLQTVKQIKNREISETDLAIGKTFLKGIKLTAIASQIDEKTLPETYYMGRLELRVTI